MRIDRFGDEQHGRRAVDLGISGLRPGVRMKGETPAIEDGARVVLLRLVIEDKHGLARDVHRRVIVISDLRRRDPETCEDEAQSQVKGTSWIGKERGINGKGVLLFAATRHDHRRPLAVEPERYDVERLEIVGPASGSKPNLLHFGRNEPRGLIRAAAQRHAPFERGRGEKLDVGTHPVRADLRLGDSAG